MSQGLKNRKLRLSDSYAALKSSNEMYYQLASIFKQVSETEERLAESIVSRLVMKSLPKISLENTI